MRKSTLGLAACLVALAAAPAARAKDRFPAFIHDDLHLDYEPPCRVCHIQGTTGAGSVSTPFGTAMLAHGMTGDESTLAPALAALEADGTDSDGDGTPDVAELRANSDPNTPVPASLVSGDPKYGCAVAGAARVPGAALAAVSALVLAAARRRRARRD